jgi:hypothetical protein
MYNETIDTENITRKILIIPSEQKEHDRKLYFLFLFFYLSSIIPNSCLLKIKSQVPGEEN